ncbi:hypothetical protein [Gelidibacter maritimus]|uniref:Uncharacterized protein n=1 Tax=Gelidibacter maritimus TaxID=2761487 RepID=A0A7W2M5P9_9FLAO|nr:hypothetical protein [Gelidibacter maritimus]MBA6153185.1 hypothetical protein [Gelidibacter maritimus]
MTNIDQPVHKKPLFLSKNLNEKSFFSNVIFFSLKLISLAFLITFSSCDKSYDSMDDIVEVIIDPTLKVDTVLLYRADLGDTLSTTGKILNGMSFYTRREKVKYSHTS